VEDDAKIYTADVKGLRMATTYSFEVRNGKEQGEREDRAEGDDKNQNIIVIPTKGCMLHFCSIYLKLLQTIKSKRGIAFKTKYVDKSKSLNLTTHSISKRQYLVET
jgi:hypothetical protein